MWLAHVTPHELPAFAAVIVFAFGAGFGAAVVLGMKAFLAKRKAK